MSGVIHFRELTIAPFDTPTHYSPNRAESLRLSVQGATERWFGGVVSLVACHLVAAGFKVRPEGQGPFMNAPRRINFLDSARHGLEVDGDLADAMEVLRLAGFKIKNGEVLL